MLRYLSAFNNWCTDLLQGSFRQSIALSTDGLVETWYVVKMKRTRSKDWGITEVFVTSSIEEVVARVDTGTPTSFCLCAHPSLIHRAVENVSDPVEALSQALPGADPQDFRLDIGHLGAKTWLVAVRKEVFEPVVQKVSSFHLDLVGQSCGILSAWALLPAWKDSVLAGEILSNHYLLQTAATDPGELEKVEKSEFLENLTEFEMDGHSLHFEHLVAAATILDSTYAVDSGKRAIASKKAKPFVIATLGVWIAILIGGTAFTKQQNSSVVALQTQVRANRSYGKIQEEESRKNEASKEEYESLGMGLQHNAAYYIDRCASLVKGVTIRELHFAPEISETYPRLFRNEVLIVNGSTSKQSEISKLISKLESADWVAGVKVLSMGEDSFSNNDRVSLLFSLEISLSDIE